MNEESDPTRRCATPLYVTFLAAVGLLAAGGLCLFVAWVLECP